jgi:hypothetical protein
MKQFQQPGVQEIGRLREMRTASTPTTPPALEQGGLVRIGEQPPPAQKLKQAIWKKELTWALGLPPR